MLRQYLEQRHIDLDSGRSCLALVPPGVEDIHFHPLEPRMVRFTLSAYFWSPANSKKHL